MDTIDKESDNILIRSIFSFYYPFAYRYYLSEALLFRGYTLEIFAKRQKRSRILSERTISGGRPLL
jgi:hypothetical protein